MDRGSSMGKRYYCPQMVLEYLDTHMQNYEPAHRPDTLHKCQLKIDLRYNFKIQNYKRVKNNMGKNLQGLMYGDDILDAIPKAPFLKERINSWYSLKLKKKFLLVKDNIKRTKYMPQTGIKYL